MNIGMRAHVTEVYKIINGIDAANREKLFHFATQPTEQQGQSIKVVKTGMFN